MSLLLNTERERRGGRRAGSPWGLGRGAAEPTFVPATGPQRPVQDPAVPGRPCSQFVPELLAAQLGESPFFGLLSKLPTRASPFFPCRSNGAGAGWEREVRVMASWPPSIRPHPGLCFPDRLSLAALGEEAVFGGKPPRNSLRRENNRENVSAPLPPEALSRRAFRLGHDKRV